MPTDPAPEKVAALEVLAGALYEAAAGTRCGMDGPEALVLARGQRERLNAAGYDVARIEEGERLRAAITEALDELDNVRWDDIWQRVDGWEREHEGTDLARWSRKYVGYVRETLSAALAASDEAASR